MQSPLFFIHRRQWVYLLLGMILLAILGFFSLSTSRAQFTQLSFGQDRAIQLVDPAGMNQLPFWLNSEAATVDFTLYHLPAADFLTRYATYQPYQPQAINVTGLSVAISWQQSFATGSWYDPRPVSLPTGTVASGIYVIRAISPGLGEATSMVVVGRTVLVLKRGAGGQVVAWASYLQNGAPVSDMNVIVYAANGSVITQGNTDSDGLLTLTVGNATPSMAIGTAGTEVTIAGLDQQWRSDGSYWWYEPAQENYRIYLYTDRPIYRPGHTVYYHAFVRNNLLSGYTPLAATEPVTVTLRDARNNVVATETKNADAFGALDGAFLLGDEPPLGTYNIELGVHGQIQRQQLRVEEYRKPEYAVEVQAATDFAVAGDQIPLTVAADYFFGQPVGAANVTLKVYRQRLYRYNYWWWHDYGYYNRELVTTLNGVTNSNGRWETLFTPEVTSDYDALYSFEATVTDALQQPISGSRDVRVYWNTFTLGVATPKYGYRADEGVTVNLQAQGHDQAAIAGQKATVRIVRHSWEDQSETDAVPPQQTNTDNQGKATLTFANVPQGWYRLVATSTDGRGRTVTAYSYLWVYDPASNVWWYTNDDQLSITSDRDSYTPGDTAQLLIQSRVTGVALLTLERDGVYEERIVPINGPITTVDVPITSNLAPNVFAKIHIFAPTKNNFAENRREGQLHTAQTELTVPATDKRLTVALSTAAPQYRPGEQATVTVQVTDANGQPVAARVGLALVDEAIFALQADLSADLFATFYGPKQNSVATYDSLVRRPYNYFAVPMSEVTGTPVAEAPAAEDTANGATSQPRRTFLDTAYWNPNLVTDANGKATINIPLPDNLTTWRILARAITIDTKVGDARAKLLVTKAIIARPALPRFGVVGDQFMTGLVAQNFSGSDTSGTTQLAATNLLLLNGATQSVNLPNGGSAVSNWTTVASKIGTGLVTTTLTTANGQDIVELPFTIKPFSAPERWVAAGQAAPVASETFTVPFNAVNDVSALTVRLSPSLALGLLDGLDELIDYPYGCVEQTMSRVLPSAVASKAYTDLGIPNPKAAELTKIINQGLQKLYGFQHSDGSWGWFYDDSGGVYLSSYVLLGLTMVQQNGFTVEPSVLDKGFAYLDSHLSTAGDAGTLAFALYVKAVAARADLVRTQTLKVRINEMDSAAVAALALALHLGGDGSGAQSVLDQLLARAVTTPTTAYWPLTTNKWEWYHWQSMASTEKNTALTLKALVTLRPNHPFLPATVRWLMENRQGAGWNNTQATAFAVLGLADTIRATGELQANYGYAVLLNGQTVATGQVTPATVRQPIAPLVITGDRFQRGENQLEVRRDNSDTLTPLYYTAVMRQELFYDSFTPVTSIDQGLALKRSYRLTEGIQRKDSAYEVGDVVEVTLEVEVREQMAYLLVEDPLPAGFEALQERMNPIVYYDGFPNFFWEEWGYNRKNIRDDRVDFFITQAWPGIHRLTYLMRATTPGEFSVLPGQAYPMYKESVWGRSASQWVRVTPEQLKARPTLLGDFDRNCAVTRFDTWQVAGAWGTNAPTRNLVGSAQIDLSDVAAVVQREGVRCLADHGLPAQGNGAVQLTVATPEQTIQIGERFTVTIDLAAGVNGSIVNGIGGVGLALRFDPTLLAVADVQWPQGDNSLPLGPQTDAQGGVLRVGVYNPPVAANLMTITFVGRGVGAANLAVIDSEAVNAAGERITAEVQTSGGVTVEGKQLFLPVVRR